MGDLLISALNWTVAASAGAVVVAVIAACVQLTVGRRIAPAWRGAMWAVVLARLVVPVPGSRLSWTNWLPLAAPQSRTIDQNQARVVFGVVPNSDSAEEAAGGSAIHATAPVVSDWRVIAASVWIAVAAALLIRLIVGNLRFRRRLRMVPTLGEERPRQLLERCRRRVRTPRVRLVEIDAVRGPALFGVFKPTLLLPPGSAVRLSDAELECIFSHELMHARRHDLLIDWLVAPVVIAHWFNPIAWLAARQLRVERELACDERVLAGRSATERATYVQTVLRIFEQFAALPSPLVAAGMTDPRGALRRRVRAMAEPMERSAAFSLVGLLALAVVGCASLGTTPGTAPDRPRLPSASADVVGKGLVVQVYDVRDLLVKVRDVSVGPSSPGGPGHFPAMPGSIQPAGSRLDGLNELTRQILANVEPSSWQAVGPGTITIDAKWGQLAVTQTPAIQAKVWEYLQSLRGTWMEISIESDVFRGAPDEFGSFSSLPGMTSFKPDQVKKLLDNVQGDPRITTVSQPRLALFNGQRAYLEVATSIAYVAGYHPASATQPSATPGFVADTANVESGAFLDVQAVVSADHQFVTLTLKPQINRLVEMKRARWADAPADRNDLTVQVPHVETAKLDTTVSIANKGAALLKMMAREGDPTATQPSRQGFYILLRPTIIEAHPEESGPPVAVPAGGAR